MTLGASTLARKYDQFVNNDALNNFFQTGWQKSLYTSVSKAFQGNQSLFFSYNLNDIAGIVPGNKDQRHSAKLAYASVEPFHTGCNHILHPRKY